MHDHIGNAEYAHKSTKPGTDIKHMVFSERSSVKKCGVRCSNFNRASRLEEILQLILPLPPIPGFSFQASASANHSLMVALLFPQLKILSSRRTCSKLVFEVRTSTNFTLAAFLGWGRGLTLPGKQLRYMEAQMDSDEGVLFQWHTIGRHILLTIGFYQKKRKHKRCETCWFR